MGTETKGPSPTIPTAHVLGTVPNYFSCPFYYSFCRNRYFEFDSFFLYYFQHKDEVKRSQKETRKP